MEQRGRQGGKDQWRRERKSLGSVSRETLAGVQLHVKLPYHEISRLRIFSLR